MNPIVIMAVVLLATLLSVLLIGAVSRKRWYVDETLPPALASARLYASEQDMRIRKPFLLVGRPDQIFRIGKRLILTDTKRRTVARAYYSDRVQLSLYRLLLERAANPWWWFLRGRLQVDPVGWLRCITTNGIKYVPVKLLEETVLVDLNARYQASQRDERYPSPAPDPGLCRGCQYQAECPHR